MSTLEKGIAIVGIEFSEFFVDVDGGLLKLFLQVIGETRDIYTDLDAARDAGFAAIPIPPTYLFTLEFQRPDPQAIYRILEVDIRQVLHGEQKFTYHSPAYVGDHLKFTPRISDYYEKKEGALRFIQRSTTVHRGETLIADLQNLVVVRELDLT